MSTATKGACSSISAATPNAAPYTKSVLPDVVDVAKTSASGPGVTYMISNQVMQFDIEARDQYSNKKAVDGLSFTVIIGSYPIVTLEKRRLSMIGNLV